MDFWSTNDYSRLLSSGYVYYERLNSDGTEQNAPRLNALYNKMRGVIVDEAWGIVGENLDYDIIASELERQARSELSKEISCVEQAFGITGLNPDLMEHKDLYKKLIEAFNTKLQTQQIFERNKARLIYTNKAGETQSLGKIDISKFFGEYFMKNFRDQSDAIGKEVINRVSGNLKFKEALTQVLQEKMPDLLRQSLINMYSSNTLNADWSTSEPINQETKNAYSELVMELQNFQSQRGNEFIQQIWDLYNFDSLLQNLVDTITEESNNDINQMSIASAAEKSDAASKVRYQTTAGELAEIQTATLVNLVADQMAQGNTNTFRIEAQRTGGSGSKADVIIGINMDLTGAINAINDKLNSATVQKRKSLRERNIIANEAAVKWLTENTTDKSFIVYVSNKDYTINDDFRGFSSGSALALTNFQSILGRIPGMGSLKNSKMLVGTLLQYGSGAIGPGTKTEEIIMKSLASAMAYFLFDDFSTVVSENNPPDTAKSLHLFWLSGFYVPLSLLLEVSAKAIRAGGKESDSYFRFSLHSPAILYGNTEFSEYTHEMWESQREFAMASTTISMKFLHSFEQLMTEYLT